MSCWLSLWLSFGSLRIDLGSGSVWGLYIQISPARCEGRGASAIVEVPGILCDLLAASCEVKVFAEKMAKPVG